MKANSQDPATFESTYALIIRSEERGIAETLVYMLLMMSTVLAIAQFGQTPIRDANCSEQPHRERYCAAAWRVMPPSPLALPSETL